jgi:hypothetical protein
MAQHYFEPHPDGIPDLCKCEMPRRNRAHLAPARAPRPAAVSHRVSVALDAPATSTRAATRASERAGSVRFAVLRHLADSRYAATGRTDKELLADLAGYNPNTVRPRRIDLARDGYVTALLDEHGQPVLREDSQAWTVTERGRARLTLSHLAVAS